MSTEHAKAAYGHGFESALAEGRICVGKPTLKEGDSLFTDAAGRYIIYTSNMSTVDRVAHSVVVFGGHPLPMDDLTMVKPDPEPKFKVGDTVIVNLLKSAFNQWKGTIWKVIPDTDKQVHVYEVDLRRGTPVQFIEDELTAAPAEFTKADWDAESPEVQDAINRVSRQGQASGEVRLPDSFTLDQLADACVEAEIPDSQYASLELALKSAERKVTHTECGTCSGTDTLHSVGCPEINAAVPTKDLTSPLAVFKYSLIASTGYEATGSFEVVTPTQYGQMIGAMESIMSPKFMRERFEAWVKQQNLSIPKPGLKRDEKGDYVLEPIQIAWRNWQAAITFKIGG
jgi:hypothetical protein